ncbi:MAG: hypothetical protein EAZ28_00875 [Oscillatoriales cyanobacterium]|nr:MAG: hypothetical protein EAZ28_00875 [Oscillatoriales cyanobacterium]
MVRVARRGPGKSEDGIYQRSQKSYDCKDTWLLPSYCDRLIVAADRPQNLLDKILPRSLGCTVKKTGKFCQPDRQFTPPTLLMPRWSTCGGTIIYL